MTEVVHIGLGSRGYHVHIGPGIAAQAGALLKPFVRGIVPVVTDDNVAKFHAAVVIASLRAAGLEPRLLTLEPGEQVKSFSGLEKLCSLLIDSGVERGGMVVALGGGVIGDLAGLAAGLVKRGLDFAQIPTTLLAQVDSSVGGKTAIDMPQGKNLVGLFHQPKIVIADTALLATLPRRELLSGYAEIVKYGALGDLQFFAWLEANVQKLLSGTTEAMVRAIAHCVRMKAAIVARDERDVGERALLNLGHTFGHALEAAGGYSRTLLHGEAVAIGMVLAFRLSAKLGLCPPADGERVAHHLQTAGLPISFHGISPRPSVDQLLTHMIHDKKAAGGKLTFVLVRGLGRAFMSNDVPPAAVREILSA